jgi:chromatin remodeling complex protein RSC6
MEGKQVRQTKQAKQTEVVAPAQVDQVEQVESTQEATEVSVESFQQICDRMATKLLEASKNLKEAQQDFKQLLRTHQREVKSARKNRRHQGGDASTKKHNPSGFNRETAVPETIVQFLGLESGTVMARTKVTSALYTYIREHGLQNHMVGGKVDKRTIVPDEKLRTLFNLGKDETIEFKTFQTHVSKLYNAEKGKEEVVTQPAPQVATPVATPVVQAKPAVKSSGKATKPAKNNA